MYTLGESESGWELIGPSRSHNSLQGHTRSYLACFLGLCCSIRLVTFFSCFHIFLASDFWLLEVNKNLEVFFLFGWGPIWKCGFVILAVDLILPLLLRQNYLLGRKETCEMTDRNKEALLEVSDAVKSFLCVLQDPLSYIGECCRCWVKLSKMFGFFLFVGL